MLSHTIDKIRYTLVAGKIQSIAKDRKHSEMVSAEILSPEEGKHLGFKILGMWLVPTRYEPTTPVPAPLSLLYIPISPPLPSPHELLGLSL